MNTPEENRQPQPNAQQAADEPSQLPPRVLYGYLRVVRGDTERAAAFKADLFGFCRIYGFMLGTVFTDWGVEDTTIARPGFSSLLDVCTLVGSYGVLTPTRAHLSSHAETQAVLVRQIQRTGVPLIAADEFVATTHVVNGVTPGTGDDAAAERDGS
jgi:hypothetical protein